MKRRVYLSGRFPRRAEMRRYRDDLERLGHTTLSNFWIEAPEELGPQPWTAISSTACEWIAEADLFLAFADADPSTAPGAGRGGRHAEFGFALAIAAMAADLDGRIFDVVLVGAPEEQLMHHHPIVRRFAAWPEALRWIGPAASPHYSA